MHSPEATVIFAHATSDVEYLKSCNSSSSLERLFEMCPQLRANLSGGVLRTHCTNIMTNWRVFCLLLAKLEGVEGAAPAWLQESDCVKLYATLLHSTLCGILNIPVRAVSDALALRMLEPLGTFPRSGSVAGQNGSPVTPMEPAEVIL